mgnify:CR=1 FL=1
MPIIPKEEALKHMRQVVALLLLAGEEPPAMVVFSTTDGHLAVLPVYSPEAEGQGGKVAAMFQRGFNAARSGELPPDADYMLFGTMAWMLKADPAKPLRGQVKDQPASEEILQILVSAPDRVVEGWIYPVTREGGKADFAEGKFLGAGIVSPLTMAFWAGVPVGKVAAELAGKARGET